MKRLLSSLFCLMICFSVFAFCGGTVYFSCCYEEYVEQAQKNCPAGTVTVLESVDGTQSSTVWGAMQ